MKQLLLVLSIVFSASISFGQKYGNVWQFGNNTGIDFNGCTPLLVEGSNTGFEGCAAISDSTGSLLFYTNSDNVWNRAHMIMPNGQLITSGGTLSQVIIIPKPLSINNYYIVTTKIQAAGSLSLQYHEVDMTLNGGFGDVSNKNNILSTLNVTEQIAATYHSNGIDIWLISHEYGTNNFLAYLVTSAGISLTPVISGVGPAHISCISNINARGEIKVSPSGSKIACNANGVGNNNLSNFLTMFDFDIATGVVSNPVALPFSRGDFGLSFSPDNSKLYGTTWKAFNFTQNDYNYLYQFDLSSGIPSTIINSKQIIDSLQVPDSYGSVKIGPDGKVYVRNTNSSFIGVINSPNQPGQLCNYNRNGFYTGSVAYQYGLNNYIEYKTYCEPAGTDQFTPPQNIISVSPNPFSTYTTLQSSFYLNCAALTVHNSLGQIVTYMDNINGQKIILNRAELPRGVYFISLTQDNQLITTIKIVITD
jgi:hypothetical protein